MTSSIKHTFIKNKVFLIALIAIIVLLVTYASAWFKLDSMAKGYYADAMRNYESGKIMAALKGEKVLSADSSEYIYHGGFEQVVDAFRSKFAFPKPQVYYLAESKIENILQKNITPEIGYAIYKKFFRLDNEYLGDILIRIGDIYHAKKNFPEALKAYNLAEESFPFNSVIAGQANKKIHDLDASISHFQ
ncbi:MAG: hypothetical protein WCR55_06675 [Lentisphaerota bacterium]